MTGFFVPGVCVGDQDDVYEDLRRHAEDDAGRAPRPLRIYQLSCRRDGADCETSVGDHGPGGTVHAIFDVGDRYAVYLQGGHDIVTKRQTYAVVEFDD